MNSTTDINFKEITINTRYRGSKTKLIPSIWKSVSDLNYHSVLDCFGGTGAVSYLFKRMNKKVIYNDHLKFNHIIGRALIENSTTKLTQEDIDYIFRSKNYDDFPHLIEKNFNEIYFLNEENIWLDRIISNINEISHSYKKDMALWCLFQSCIIKRPFSLFHRKNLNIRTRDVKRSFGNKTTWETPFETHFQKFVDELNSYIFDSGIECKAMKEDILDFQLDGYNFDLVYIDPPYIPQEGENIIYRNLYHFLEGITQYNSWEYNIDQKSKHKRLIKEYNIWNDKKNVHKAFEQLIKKFKDSIILISHRSDGLPTNEVIISILKKFKSDVIIADSLEHKYALSHRKSKEILILAK